MATAKKAAPVKVPLTNSQKRAARPKHLAPGKIVSRRGSTAFQQDAEADIAEKKRIGRPSTYKPEYDEEVRRLKLLMVRDDECAEWFRIDTDTFQQWKILHPSFADAIRAGGLKADMDVVVSLAQMAMGFSYETEELKVINVTREKQEVVRHKVTVYQPPDFRAASRYLGNRRRRDWADKSDQTAGGPTDAAKAAQEAIAAADAVIPSKGDE